MPLGLVSVTSKNSVCKLKLKIFCYNLLFVYSYIIPRVLICF